MVVNPVRQGTGKHHCDGPDPGREGAGYALSFSSAIKGSRHEHMRELRIQVKGAPIRVFYAFDPRRTAILLVGGDKTGDKRFYKRMIPIADDLYDVHLDELAKEGLI